MSGTSTEEDIFTMAGLTKNNFLGRWDFLFTSPFTARAPETETHTAGSTEDDRMKLIDSIDIENLSVSEPSTPAHKAARTGTPSQEPAAAVGESKTKKKKSKKKKSSLKSNDKAVKWGNVEQVCFSRSIGYDRIPNKGSYPLGLGQETERIECTVDELFTAQQQYLLQKAVAKGLIFKTPDSSIPPPPIQPSPKLTSGKGKKSRSRSNSVTSVGSVDSTPPELPPIPESTDALDILQPLETRQFDYKSKSNPLFMPLGEAERIALLTSDTVDIPVDPDHQFVNPLTEINNEIKQLKSQRESAGCNCKHTKTDKLSIAKLRAELLSNGHLICYEGTTEDVEKLSKAELTLKVKDVLKMCVLCVTNDCQCVQMGLPCSAQVCGCLRGGHHPGQAQSCANPDGQDLYDPARVKEYRRNVLAGVTGTDNVGGSIQ